jgi:hypothetical protein
MLLSLLMSKKQIKQPFYQDKFHKKLNELAAFKQTFGHLSVPSKDPKFKAFYAWQVSFSNHGPLENVSNQRTGAHKCLHYHFHCTGPEKGANAQDFAWPRCSGTDARGI